MDLAAVVALALPIVAVAQETKTEPAKATEVKTAAPQLSKSEMKKRLDDKQTEMLKLQGKASDVTKAMAELAGSGKVPTSQEAVQAMREMVEALEAIQGQLEKIQEEIEGIKGWIEGQNEALPIMANDILDLKRHRWGNYIQVQYRDTDQKGGSNDAFSVRRTRIGITQNIDPRTVLRASFDIATGTTTNVAQMRDAFVRWDLEPSFEKVGTEIYFGQFPLPLGFELERSSGDREFPERTAYNRTMFAGERSRGVMVRHGLNEKSHIHIGGYNALTFDDPEQRSVAPGPENRLAMSTGIRFYDTQYDFGISYFKGERARVTTTRTSPNQTIVHPRVDREFLFLDGSLVGFIVPQAFLRAEYMKGKDRVPITPGAQQSISSPRGRVDMEGMQLQLGYNVNYRNQLNVRWEQFDPNKDTDGNVVTTWAAAWSYFINPGARITLSREWVNDAARAGVDDQEYQITTLRVVFRF